jgi:hypothetical protein
LFYEKNVNRDFHRHLMAMKTDSMMELSHYDRKRIHNLKYFTWIAQQMFDLNELNRQRYDYELYWGATQKLTPKTDELIVRFNERVGLT